MIKTVGAKLTKGDEIRVIAPSRSLGLLTDDNFTVAKNTLEEMGYVVTLGKNCSRRKVDAYNSSKASERAEDVMEAFKDNNVKAVLPAIGGFNVNQILSLLDYDVISKNPKIICGYSDITALCNAIFAKTGVITYSGPNFSLFGMAKGNQYTLDYFQKCMASEEAFEVVPADYWSDDAWYRDQENRQFIANEGYAIINEGRAEGTIIGGNLCTFNLLQGTEYMPSLDNTILFLEDDDLVGEWFGLEFDRNLQSVIHLKGFSGVKAIVIGRCQKGSNINVESMADIIKSKPELNKIPVVYGADFGHTTPLFTFPIGGTAKLTAIDGKVKLEIGQH